MIEKYIDRLYENAYEYGIEKIKNINLVFSGFHSVIDGLIKYDEKLFERVLRDLNVNLIIKRFNSNDLPIFIESPEDFILGFLFSFSKGKALQLMIANENTFDWIKENFGFGELRLGGTSANMAVNLAILGYKKIVLYVYPHTKEISELFPKLENLYVISSEGLVNPWKYWKEKGIKAIHWIFEFSKGQKLKIGNLEIIAPRDNRYIPSWNPVNSKLKVDTEIFDSLEILSKDISHFLLAGFHIMKDKYPDGDTAEILIRDLKEKIEKIKRKNKKLNLHLEFASIRPLKVRYALENMIFPLVDSIGINEVELSWLAKDFNIGEEEKILNYDPFEIKKVAQYILEKYEMKRFHVHTFGYYLSIIDPNHVNKEIEEKALATASLACAFRAEKGYLEKMEKVRNAFKFDYNENGLKAFEAMKDEKNVVVIPTKIVTKPKLTVGLGDTISSVAFTLSL